MTILTQASPDITVLSLTVTNPIQFLDYFYFQTYGFYWLVSVSSGQETALRDSLLTYFKTALTDLFVTALASSGYPMITSSIQSPVIYTMSERPTGMPISRLRTNQPSSSFQQSPPVSTNFRARELRTEASFIARISVTHVSFD